MFSPQETGTIPGLPRGAGKPGNRYFPGVPGIGGRRVAPGSPGNRTNRNSEAGLTGRSGPVRLGNQLIGNGEVGRLADPEP